MIRRLCPIVLAAALLLPQVASAAPSDETPTKSPQHPNILLILADDMGYGDLGCYNPKSRIPTPHMDRLAAEGVRFTDAYCPVSVCSPSRYALLAGRYPWRSWKSNGVLANWQKPMIEPGRLSLAELLKNAGYNTAGFGKWHLGQNFTTTDGRPPRGLGKFTSDDTGANIDLTKPTQGGPNDLGFDHWYGFSCASECLIFENRLAVSQIDHDKWKPPFAKGVADLPVVTLPEFLPEVTKRTLAYIEQQAEAAKSGKPFFVYFAPYVPHEPLAVENGFAGKTTAGEYGDYVHELDHYIGQLLEQLDELGLAENTLVLVASDNGSKFGTTGEGHRPNAPLRSGKYSIYEGGVRTPLVIRWPARIEGGRVCDEIISFTDLLATCAALTGQSLPKDAGEDSLNQLPLILGERDEAIRRSVVVQASSNQRAIRSGKWKYIPAKGNKAAELYDLKADPGEKNNVAGEHGAVVERLEGELATIEEGGTS